jgi:hypothetical protein
MALQNYWPFEGPWSFRCLERGILLGLELFYRRIRAFRLKNKLGIVARVLFKRNIFIFRPLMPHPSLAT